MNVARLEKIVDEMRAEAYVGDPAEVCAALLLLADVRDAERERADKGAKIAQMLLRLLTPEQTKRLEQAIAQAQGDDP